MTIWKSKRLLNKIRKFLCKRYQKNLYYNYIDCFSCPALNESGICGLQKIIRELEEL